MEETGYDISPLIRDTYLQCTIREQSIRLYIVCGVPEDTKFVPQTRKEISVCILGRKGSITYLYTHAASGMVQAG